MSNIKIDLLLIDPQNDFCDLPDSRCPTDLASSPVDTLVRPALPVPGAYADMQRTAAFIRRVGDRLGHIHVTLDSHNPVDIAHPAWWLDGRGARPAPFTVITSGDIQSGRWRSADPSVQAYSADYVSKLDAGGRYPLVVWPEHCLIGNWGHNIEATVKAELDAWARKRLRIVNYVAKGANPMTEHYSAIRAEVPDPSDPSTQLNTALIRALEKADIIVVAGEALSHCVANTVRDIADNSSPEHIRKMVLLTDCASSVSGFEAIGDAFVRDMSARGMQLANSADFLA